MLPREIKAWKLFALIIILFTSSYYWHSPLPYYAGILLSIALLVKLSFNIIYKPKDGYFKKDSELYKFIDTTFSDIQQFRVRLFAGISSIACGIFTILLHSSIFLLATLLLGAVWMAFYRGKKTPVATSPIKNKEHGSAGWASIEEIEAADVIGHDSGLYIGGNYLRKKIGPLLTLAGSRQGKGTCLIIPSLLVAPNGSYVVIDPKGENAFITARYQKETGQNVYIIDPYNEQEKFGAKHGIPISGFNPFVFLKQDIHELRDNCELMAMYLIPDNPNLKDPYWNERARSLIKILLMHIVTYYQSKEEVEEYHNFWTLYKMLRYTGADWDGLLFDLKKNEAEDGMISIAASELIGLEKTGTGSTIAGIKSAAQNATTLFESPQLRKSLKTNGLNPYELSKGKSTVYIVMPERFLETNATWLRMIVGLSLKACNARPDKRVNFLLDEFGMLGNMQDVKRGFAFASGQNVVLWVFAQSLSQLKEIYGEDGMNTFVGNAAVFQAFGVGDNFTKEYVSNMLGEGTFTKEETSSTKSNVGTENESFSTQFALKTYNRKLLTPDEVETFPGIITIIRTLRIHLLRLPYYKSLKPFFPDTAVHEWYDDFQRRADPPPRIVD